MGERREVELSDTAPAPAPAPEAPLGATADTEARPLAAGSSGLDETASAPADMAAAAVHYSVRLLRAAFITIAALAAANLTYFIARFMISASPPVLHPVFAGRTGGRPGVFGSMGVFEGPLLTLVTITVISAIYLLVTTWVARAHRAEPIVQLLALVALLGGQISMSVTVLTSEETFVVARVAAAALYSLAPLVGFTLLALFPSGRAVPRWVLWLVPVAVAPFVLQARVMFVERGYSLATAVAMFPFVGLFLGCQWYRYRHHATLRERSQIKWICYAAAMFATIQLVAITGVLPLLVDTTRPAFPFLKLVYELMIAASYLVAMASMMLSAARYRMFDVDRVINRTIVYAIVSVLLAGVALVIYFGLRATLVTALGAPAPLALALALAAAASIVPWLRRRVARWIDRRFYGIGLDYEALALRAMNAARVTLPTTGTELGAYDELVLLGRGGMGAVYRAHHAAHAAPVALKVISPRLAGDRDAEVRFEREARILEDLAHPNVVPFVASGHEKGLAFIAMAYLEGEDLATRLRARALSPGEVARIVDGIAAALDVAHARGVVHRDIKPANILVERDGRPRLMDFGVALLAGEPDASDGSMVGSLPYIAPEQIRDGATVDRRADIYALGATTFHLLTGRPPFRESTALGMVLAHLHQPAPDLRDWDPSLPVAVATLVRDALAKAPDARPETAGAFAARLRAAVGVRSDRS